MTLQQLKYVLAVAEKKNISEAARTVFISQPSLSSSIHELENEIGITIFARTNRGIIITPDGEEFLGYARQVIEQSNLLEQKYLKGIPVKPHFSVSSQHYSFVVNAFVDVIKKFGGKNKEDEYEFTLRETQTHEIIQDVSLGRSEIGILYLTSFNEKVITNLLSTNKLTFTKLFTVKPHVFISKKNPLAKKEIISLQDLSPFPFLSFEQGSYNSFYFSEEVLSTHHYEKMIKVTDRATLFNLLIGLDGYTFSTGIISKELNGPSIISRPLNVKEKMNVGFIIRDNSIISQVGKEYLNFLQKHVEPI